MAVIMDGLRFRRLRGVTARAFLIGLAGLFVAGGLAATPVDFNLEVQPLLSRSCYPCHGPDEESRKAELRLDLAGEAWRERGGTWPIKPGFPGESEVLSRITTDDRADVMPPPKAGEPLATEEIELIRRWIEEGAEYAEHWAWTKPKRPLVPRVDGSNWPRNEIDHFVLARQKARGLSRPVKRMVTRWRGG